MFGSRIVFFGDGGLNGAISNATIGKFCNDRKRDQIVTYLSSVIIFIVLVSKFDDVIGYCSAAPYGYYMGGGGGGSSSLTTADLMTSPAVNGSVATGAGGLLQAAVNRC